MKTYIYYITDNYKQAIDCTNDAETAREYIEGCATNGYWNRDEIGVTIRADIYKDDQDPLFDEPIKTTYAEIKESDTE